MILNKLTSKVEAAQGLKGKGDVGDIPLGKGDFLELVSNGLHHLRVSTEIDVCPVLFELGKAEVFRHVSSKVRRAAGILKN